MQRKILIATLGGLLALTGCGKRPDASPPTQTQTQQPTQKTAPTFDACALLKREEIQTVQGSAIKDTVSSERADGGVRVSQCYYTAEESNRSVSLAVTQSESDGAGKQKIKESWEQMFGGLTADRKKQDADKEKKESLREQPRGGEEEEKRVPPRKIEGLGDDAYWIGSRVGGTVYARKKNAFIRISLGGPEEGEAKIDKSKALAEKALQRL